MSHPEYETFCVEIPTSNSKNMEEFQKAMNDYHDEMEQHIKGLAKKFGVSEDCAANVYYLRTRSRWTQAAENELIRMDKAGEPSPNICDWPPKDSPFRS